MTVPQNSDREGDPLAADLAAKASHDHEDEIADEWGVESFPASDPPSR